MANDVMVDLETLSTSSNCVILTLGAVKFNPNTKDEPHSPLYLRVTIEDQTDIGREISDYTMEFWAKQSAEAQEEAFGDEGRISLEEMIDQFHKWAWGSKCIWSNGAIFDINILEGVYAQFNRTPAWSYWAVRDVRTMFDLGIPHKIDKSMLHNALADAYQQATGIQHIYAELGLGE